MDKDKAGLETVGKTEYKTITACKMEDKKARIKIEGNVVVVALSIATLIVLLISFFIKNDESQNLLVLIGFGLILATILFKVFKGDFANKPQREEIEERMFGNKNPEN